MDLQHLRASDGTGEAVLAHVQSVRNIGSTVLDLDNVDNWNSKCVVVTGTPNANGYIDSSGMTVMYGHITAGDFIIDGYAPGYTDQGNTTTEVAIVKMTTSWADTLIDLLDNSLNDDGTLKLSAVELVSPGKWTPTTAPTTIAWIQPLKPWPAQASPIQAWLGLGRPQSWMHGYAETYSNLAAWARGLS